MGNENSPKPSELSSNSVVINDLNNSNNHKDNSKLNSSKEIHALDNLTDFESLNDTNQSDNIRYNLFWIDENANNEENNFYKQYLKENYDKYDIFIFEDVAQSIKEMIKLSFKELYVMVSGRKYKDFIKSFMNNLTKIKVVPKIIIFTGNKEKFLEYNSDPDMKNILSNNFYNLGGIQTNFINVYNFLSTDNWRIRPKIENIKDVKKETEELTFEYIDSLESLMLPRFFRTLIKINKDDNFDELNQYYYDKYSKLSEIKELLSQIEGIPSIPLEILCKYYARLYTLESEFYDEINSNLRKESLTDSNYPVQKFVLSYVKLLYEGLRLNCFP